MLYTEHYTLPFKDDILLMVILYIYWNNVYNMVHTFIATLIMLSKNTALQVHILFWYGFKHTMQR